MRMIKEKVSGLVDSVSYTTRPKRPGERDGIDYHFMDEKSFKSRIVRGFFAEWAPVHEYYYGTSREDLRSIIEGGNDAIMDIDVQGTRQLIESFPESVSIFILPPSIEELEKRLRRRGTEEAAAIRRRLATAVEEIQSLSIYDYLIVNRDLVTSAAQLEAIITAERLNSNRFEPTDIIRSIVGGISPSGD